MKYCFLLILILWFGNSIAQSSDDSFKIEITASNAFRGKNLFVYINKQKDVIKILYKLKDSINEKSLMADKKYLQTLTYIAPLLSSRKKIDSLRIMSIILDSIREEYTHYSKDSIVISTKSEPVYAKLLLNINMTNNQTLENYVTNRDRVVLDGTHFLFLIKAPGYTREVQAHSPSITSHPLLYALLHQTMELYRKQKNKLFLTEYNTDGY